MGLEVEVKIALSAESLAELRARLQSQGSRITTPATLEVNTLFDFEDQRLARTGCALRMRSYGRVVLLTYKGAVQEDPMFKRRAEFQTLVDDQKSMWMILASLGLTPHFEYSKTREMQSLALGEARLEVCLDETPIGHFVELEGEPSIIQQAIDVLRLEREQIVKDTYVRLYLAAGMGRYQPKP